MSKNNFSICDFRKINVSKLEYSSPKTIQGGNQSSYIYYRESHNKLTSLFIRIPKLRTSSGICRKCSYYYIDLELDLTNEHSDFFDFLLKIDKNNRLITFQNSVEWFGDQIPEDTIEDYYYDTGLGNQLNFGSSHELMLSLDFGSTKSNKTRTTNPRFL